MKRFQYENGVSRGLSIQLLLLILSTYECKEKLNFLCILKLCNILVFLIYIFMYLFITSAKDGMFCLVLRLSGI